MIEKMQHEIETIKTQAGSAGRTGRGVHVFSAKNGVSR